MSIRTHVELNWCISLSFRRRVILQDEDKQHAFPSFIYVDPEEVVWGRWRVVGSNIVTVEDPELTGHDVFSQAVNLSKEVKVLGPKGIRDGSAE